MSFHSMDGGTAAGVQKRGVRDTEGWAASVHRYHGHPHGSKWADREDRPDGERDHYQKSDRLRAAAFLSAGEAKKKALKGATHKTVSTNKLIIGWMLYRVRYE